MAEGEVVPTACMGSGLGADDLINCFFAKVSDVSEGIILYSMDFGITNSDGSVVIKSVPLILIWLALASTLFTLYFTFANFRYFKHSIQILMGKFEEKNSDGEISNFQALASSLSGTVGLGNIAGVAVAISVGGPGAMVWMTIMGLMGMNTKFLEVALGIKYRKHLNPDDPKSISGGPMYYLKEAFTQRNLPVLGAIVAAFFAICAIGGSLGAGNMFQANQAYVQILNISGGENSIFFERGWMFGLILAACTGMVIMGGLHSIANVASKLVPIMGLIYISAGLIVVMMNYAAVPEAIATIFTEAFTPAAGLGGLIGGLLVGVQRASFSNEAGLGSAAIVHATAKTDYPVRQGFVGMMGPFIDTVVICNVTALVIIVTGAYKNTDGMQGVALTSDAFASAVSWFPYILALTVVLFAFSTMITWYYYGEKALAYLMGEKKIVKTCLKIVFLCGVVLGASAELTNVIRFTDAMILSMGIPNVIGLYMLAPEIKKDLEAYAKKFIK